MINSVPDMVNYYNGMGNPSMVIGQVIGSNLMILGLTLGLISLLCQNSSEELQVHLEAQIESPLRSPIVSPRLQSYVDPDEDMIQPHKIDQLHDQVDSLLYSVLWLATVILMFIYIIYDGKITTIESLVMIGTYLVYLSHLLYSPQPPIIDIDEQLEHEPQSNLHYFVHAVVFLLGLVINSPLRYFNLSVLVYFKIPSVYVVMALVILSPSLYLSKTKYVVAVANSILVISYISSMVVKIIVNYGAILKITGFSLGYLIFSIANSLNDTVTNVTLSFINPDLGRNACLGTPVLLILLGLGVNCIKGIEFDGFKLGAMGLLGILVIVSGGYLVNWGRVTGVLLVSFWLMMELISIIKL
ncbi:hypothetical protein CLIB1444_01S14730 [[Candida] jaroonii]|uniref:Uncharacterized protein n=1 Tax=[Candida] jaroonii TaxID=467808 RepID=A0ACA9Y1G7_9ASCO|nr:hypothetical protein CLIB1444_01S14730 [[Candida] jaroonii]